MIANGAQSVLMGQRRWAVDCADSLAWLKALPAECVQVCVTSPPYLGLRDYGTGTWEGGDAGCKHEKTAAPLAARPSGGLTGGKDTVDAGNQPFRAVCGHCGARRVDQQIGLEESPREYVRRLVEVFAEVRRVLHPTGVLFVNIADSYGSGEVGRADQLQNEGICEGVAGVKSKVGIGTRREQRRLKTRLNSGSLLGIPWRLARALQRDGWLLRAECLWVKLAAMPSSQTGWRWVRCRRKVGNKCPTGTQWQQQVYGEGNHKEAIWSPCPGCPKCQPTGGWVLRKGAWRPTTAHEMIYLFAKSRRYFMDGDGPFARQPARSTTVARDRYTRVLDDPDEQFAVRHDHETDCGGTATLRSWWTFQDERGPLRLKPGLSEAQRAKALATLANSFELAPSEQLTSWLIFKTEALSEKHYAAFSSSLPTLLYGLSTPEKGVCSQCGTPWAREVEKDTCEFPELNGSLKGAVASANRKLDGKCKEWQEASASARTVGWRPCCSCDAPARRPVVMDCFTGSGTSGIAARRLDLDFVGCDLSAEYVALANRRIEAALRPTKRGKRKDATPSLFSEDAGC